MWAIGRGTQGARCASGPMNRESTVVDDYSNDHKVIGQIGLMIMFICLGIGGCTMLISIPGCQ